MPSFCAAAARLARPLVSGEDRLHIIPASYDVGDCESLDGVKVLMKPGKSIDRLRRFKLCGVENCTMEDERIFNSADEAGEPGYFSLFIVD